MIVVDTNVIVYLYVSGEATTSARALLAYDPAWAAPPLWRSEFRNALALHMRHGLLALEDALTAHTAAERRLRGREHMVDGGAVLRLAAESGRTAYDCEFVALARSLGVPLVTSDRQVLASFPETAVALASFGGA